MIFIRKWNLSMKIGRQTAKPVEQAELPVRHLCSLNSSHRRRRKRLCVGGVRTWRLETLWPERRPPSGWRGRLPAGWSLRCETERCPTSWTETPDGQTDPPSHMTTNPLKPGSTIKAHEYLVHFCLKSDWPGLWRELWSVCPRLWAGPPSSSSSS